MWGRNKPSAHWKCTETHTYNPKELHLQRMFLTRLCSINPAHFADQRTAIYWKRPEELLAFTHPNLCSTWPATMYSMCTQNTADWRLLLCMCVITFCYSGGKKKDIDFDCTRQMSIGFKQTPRSVSGRCVNDEFISEDGLMRWYTVNKNKKTKHESFQIFKVIS